VCVEDLGVFSGGEGGGEGGSHKLLLGIVVDEEKAAGGYHQHHQEAHINWTAGSTECIRGHCRMQITELFSPPSLPAGGGGSKFHTCLHFSQKHLRGMPDMPAAWIGPITATDQHLCDANKSTRGYKIYKLILKWIVYQVPPHPDLETIVYVHRAAFTHMFHGCRSQVDRIRDQ